MSQPPLTLPSPHVPADAPRNPLSTTMALNPAGPSLHYLLSLCSLLSPQLLSWSALPSILPWRIVRVSLIWVPAVGAAGSSLPRLSGKAPLAPELWYANPREQTHGKIKELNLERRKEEPHLCVLTSLTVNLD